MAYKHVEFPAWRYGPNGEAQIFDHKEEVPNGWVDSPAKVGKPQPKAPAPKKAEVLKAPETKTPEVKTPVVKSSEMKETVAKKAE